VNGLDRIRAALRSLQKELTAPSPLSLWEVWMTDRANRLEARLLRLEVIILTIAVLDALLVAAFIWFLK